jgi:hypothetical protein
VAVEAEIRVDRCAEAELERLQIEAVAHRVVRSRLQVLLVGECGRSKVGYQREVGV